MEVTPGYHLSLPPYSSAEANYVACADVPELGSVALLQYGLAGLANMCLDILYLPTGATRRVVLDGAPAGTYVAAIRAIGTGLLLISYQAYAETAVYLQVVDAGQTTPTVGAPVLLLDPAVDVVIPDGLFTGSAPPGIHQITPRDFVACYLGIDGVNVPAAGSYTLSTYTARITIAGVLISATGWEAGPTKTLAGTPGAYCGAAGVSPIWVDEAVNLTALIGPVAGGGSELIAHAAAAFLLRFDGPKLSAIEHVRLRAGAGVSLEATWNAPYYKNRALGVSTYISPDPGRSLLVGRLGGTMALVAANTEFGSGLRGSIRWSVDHDGTLDYWQAPTSLVPDIWQKFNADATEIIYIFRIGNEAASINATDLLRMPGADLSWVYVDTAQGGWYSSYSHMIATASNYLLAYDRNPYGVDDDVHVSVWRFAGVGDLAPGKLTTTGYFT